jgi:hypothetical protein
MSRGEDGLRPIFHRKEFSEVKRKKKNPSRMALISKYRSFSSFSRGNA